MCVLMLCDEKRPDPETIRRAWHKNKDGGGVGSIIEVEEEGKIQKKMRWKKGLTLDQMLEECATLPLPFIPHFRAASTGMLVIPELCHPFVADEHATSDLEGETVNPLIFHNGTWNDWRKESWEAAKSTGVPIPGGRWSDTRAIAWMTYLFGEGALEFIHQRTIFFSPDRLETYGPGWEKVEGIWMGFTHQWNFPIPSFNPGAITSKWCKVTSCNRKDIDDSGFCPDHRPKKKAGESQQTDTRITHLLPREEPGGAPAGNPFVRLDQAVLDREDKKLTPAEFRRIRKQCWKAILTNSPQTT